MCCAIAKNELYIDKEICAKTTATTIRLNYDYYFANGNCERVDPTTKKKEDWADVEK